MIRVNIHKSPLLLKFYDLCTSGQDCIVIYCCPKHIWMKMPYCTNSSHCVYWIFCRWVFMLTSSFSAIYSTVLMLMSRTSWFLSFHLAFLCFFSSLNIQIWGCWIAWNNRYRMAHLLQAHTPMSMPKTMWQHHLHMLSQVLHLMPCLLLLPSHQIQITQDLTALMFHFSSLAQQNLQLGR